MDTNNKKSTKKKEDEISVEEVCELCDWLDTNSMSISSCCNWASKYNYAHGIQMPRQLFPNFQCKVTLQQQDWPKETFKNSMETECVHVACQHEACASILNYNCRKFPNTKHDTVNDTFRFMCIIMSLALNQRTLHVSMYANGMNLEQVDE